MIPFRKTPHGENLTPEKMKVVSAPKGARGLQLCRACAQTVYVCAHTPSRLFSPSRRSCTPEQRLVNFPAKGQRAKTVSSAGHMVCVTKAL